MKVVIVHNRYRSASPSGENRVVDEDVERLRADGVEVVTYFRESDEVEQWSRWEKASLAIRPTISPQDVRRFRALLRVERPDIVHLHNPFPIISPWVIRTAKEMEIPVVQTVHNYRHTCVNGLHFRDGAACLECRDKRFPTPALRHGCYQGSQIASVPMIAAQIVHRSTWHQVDRFLPVGRDVGRSLEELGVPTQRIIIRPNVVTDPGPPAPVGSGILYVGRLSEEKGVRLLIDAWVSEGLGRHSTLTIAGDGDLRSMVRDATAKHASITDLGLVPQSMLPNLYRDSALVVIPSICFEAHPLALVTAQAHGRAVVAVNSSVTRSHVTEDSGWLADPTPDAFGATLRTAMSDPSEVVRRGIGAREAFKDLTGHPSPSLGQIYQSVCDDRTGRAATERKRP